MSNWRQMLYLAPIGRILKGILDCQFTLSSTSFSLDIALALLITTDFYGGSDSVLHCLPASWKIETVLGSRKDTFYLLRGWIL